MYKLIAFDMDGTLLNSKKEISQKTLDAMNKAANEGKYITISTGRSISELKPYKDVLKMVRYAILASATIIYDFKEEKMISRTTIPKKYIKNISDAIASEDVMILAMSEGLGIVPNEELQHIDDYYVGQYKSLYEDTAELVDDILEVVSDEKKDFEKINLYHRDEEARERSLARLNGLDLEMVFSEKTSLEITPKGADKGAGLEKLCEYLGIDISETIAVGDADNDLSIIKKAGLGVAMANANERVKEASDVIVADCDHDGCAEAIENYLMK